ncbi:hypothetical protein [Desulfurivibrio alkaliphilus]|uniref:Uncharacterized protein n=1 Tax=Desulfurivibrio alkaliphilus (strain DSM 19089 / UNIQEM U267 / AHT2) TaxID=589865 RepID=D6Z4J5_DESAT|nr:hypothetical protein [Desulfurivibrio alkaliphilus]ADH86470.1 hypothetical protein DaAHT2_1779 [Desulfurivibrio alkaliphilus AHT 2]
MKTKIARFFPLLLLLLLLAACSGDSGSSSGGSSSTSTEGSTVADSDDGSTVSTGSSAPSKESSSTITESSPVADSDEGAADSTDEGSDEGNDEATIAGITGGVVVDPYIVGATFFEDVNGNGRWDEGEQISTPSDEQGRFAFATPVPAGNAIIMLERGTHQGLPFAGQLMHLVAEEDSDTVVVTPLTTLSARAFADGDISSLLTAVNGYRDYDLAVDPMAGLVGLNGSVNQDDLVDLRANLYVGALLDLFQVGRTIEELNGYNLEPDNYELLYGLREGLLYATDPGAQNDIIALLPMGYDLPPVSMREVAETLPAILNWWKQELISKALQDQPVAVSADDFMDMVDAVQAELGLHYYLRHHQDDAGVQSAIAAGLLPAIETTYVAIGRNNTVGPVEAINYGVLLEQPLLLGDNGRLRFSKDSEGAQGLVELVLGDNSLSGTWQIEEVGGEISLLILKDDNASLELELEANRNSHLSLRIRARADDYDETGFLGQLMNAAGNFQIS